MKDYKPLLYYILESLHLKSLVKHGKATDKEKSLLAEYSSIIKSSYKKWGVPEGQHPPTERQLYYCYGLWKSIGKPYDFLNYIYKYDLWLDKTPDKYLGHLDIAHVIDSLIYKKQEMEEQKSDQLKLNQTPN